MTFPFAVAPVLGVAATHRKPRILMFAPQCIPPHNPEGIVNAKLVKMMLGASWKVDVISRANDVSPYPSRTDGILEGVAVATHSIYMERGWDVRNTCYKARGAVRSGHVVRSIRWVDSALSLGLELARTNNYDFVLSRSSPVYAHLPALVVSQRYGIPWIANWNDPDPMGSCPPPYGTGPDARIPFWMARFLRAVVARASWHTYPCIRLGQYLSALLGHRLLTRGSVIPHPALDTPVHRTRPRGNEFVICHGGAVTFPRDPGPFLVAIRRLFDTNAEFGLATRVRFIGDWTSDLGSLTEQLGLSQVVRAVAPVDYEQALAEFANADVLAVIEAPLVEGIFFPSKCVDYVQTGRPILAISPCVGTLNDLLGAHGGGICADCTCAESVEGALSKLFAAWKGGTLDRDYGSTQLFPIFSNHAILPQYATLFTALTAERSTTRQKGMAAKGQEVSQ
jgi:hypothetical protein